MVEGELRIVKSSGECINIHPDDLFNYKLEEGDHVDYEMVRTIIEECGDEILYERRAKINHIFINL